MARYLIMEFIVLGNEKIKTPKKFLLGALALLIIVWVTNHFTGFLTTLHLRNEETMALKHGMNSPLYKQMLDELIGDAMSEQHWERKVAAVELGHLGAGAARAIPVLEGLIDDEALDVRIEAAIALARIGSHSEKAVPVLIEVLQHHSDNKKYLAVLSLGIIGGGAGEAVPSLIHELKEGHADLRQAILTALENIGTPEALQAIKQENRP